MRTRTKSTTGPMLLYSRVFYALLLFLGHHENSANAERVHGTFVHGVASGDPTHDAVVIWTRVTPTGRDPGERDPAPDITFPITWVVSRIPPQRKRTKKPTQSFGTQPPAHPGDAWVWDASEVAATGETTSRWEKDWTV